MPECNKCEQQFFWARGPDQRWHPVDPDTITGDETEIEPGVITLEAWHRRHKCPSRFKRKVASTPESPPRVVAFGSFNFDKLAAFNTLHLLPDAPPEVIRAAHRALAALHHPDRGGDVSKMVEINAAYELLKR